MVIWCMYTMYNDQIRIIGISISLNIPHIFCVKTLQTPVFWLFIKPKKLLQTIVTTIVEH
jgi:hypothetical protein